MTYSVHCASEWPLDRLAPYLSEVLREMGRLAKRFPNDATTEALFTEFLAGKKTLWLILEGDDFVSMALSTVRTVDSTGTRMATLCDMAGKNVQGYASELCEALEAWADKNNCDIRAIEGREGWKPLLAQHGYKPHAVLYRKSR